MFAERIRVVIDVVADGATRGINEIKTRVAEAEGAFGKFRAGISGAFDMLRQNSSAAAAAAAVAVGKFVSDAVKDASNLEESINAVNVTFGDVADEVLKIGEGAAESMGLSRSEFNAAAVQFSSFAKTVAGEGGDVAGVLQDITQRAADFASVHNIEVAEAMRVFMSTMAGETEPIRRYGKDVSAAAVELHALREGLVDSRAEITESIKVQARYGLLMEETSEVAGDFAETSESAANAQRRFQASMENLSATAGKTLLPILAQTADAGADVAAAFDKADDSSGGWLSRALSTPVWELPGWFHNLGAEIGFYTKEVEHAADFNSRFTESQDRVAQSIYEWQRSAHIAAETAEDYTRSQREIESSVADSKAEIDANRESVQAWFDTVNENISSMFDFEQSAIDVATGYADLTQQITETEEALNSSEASAAEKEQALRDLRSAEISLAEEIYATAEAYATEQGATEGTTRAAQEQINYLRIAQIEYPHLADEIDLMIAELERVPGASTNAGEGLAEGVETGAEGAQTAARDMVPAITDEVNRGRAAMESAGQNLGEGVAAGLRDKIQAAADAAREVVRGALDAAVTWADIRSPSRKFAEEVGEPISEGVAQGITDAGPQLAESMVDAIEEAKREAIDAARDMVDELRGIVRDIWGEIDSDRQIEGLQGDIVDAEGRLSDAKAEAADAAREYGVGSDEHAKALDRVSDAQERLMDLNYRLLKAQEDAFTQGEINEQQYRDLAVAAGLEIEQIDALIAKLKELAAARGQQAVVDETARKFGVWAETGRWSQAELDRVAGLDPAAQQAAMASMVRQAEADLAAYQKAMGISPSDLGAITQAVADGVVNGTMQASRITRQSGRAA